jgi:hypothetical protein
MKKTLFLLVSISVLAFFIPQNHTVVQHSNLAAEVEPSIGHPIYPPV